MMLGWHQGVVVAVSAWVSFGWSTVSPGRPLAGGYGDHREVEFTHNRQRSSHPPKAVPIWTSTTSSVLSSVWGAAAEETDDEDNREYSDSTTPDLRPHEQRAPFPRPARRLNHGFRYLYRHTVGSPTERRLEPTEEEEEDDDDPLHFLVHRVGYSPQQVKEINQSFPPLLSLLSVRRQLFPMMQFLQYTLMMMNNNNATTNTTNISSSGIDRDLLAQVPPQYWGARLEATVAPRHAFLVYVGLPHGRQLFHTTLDSCPNEKTSFVPTGSITTSQIPLISHSPPPPLLHSFLAAGRSSQRFAELCRQWQPRPLRASAPTPPVVGPPMMMMITSKQIEAFEALFSRGLLAAARNELVQPNNTWPLQYIHISADRLIQLLIQHGANPLERDHRGVSLLHWAAATGNVNAVRELLPYFANEGGVAVVATRDGATPLHWAAAGAHSRAFGTGGHLPVGQFLVSQISSSPAARIQYINQGTYDGNSALMWAAWSGSLDVVQFLIQAGAHLPVTNRNGCTVAHWAASGGHLETCQYLAACGVDFTQPNLGGNTPLTHAVAFGRKEVVEWLMMMMSRPDVNAPSASISRMGGRSSPDAAAYHLAQDFVHWTEGDGRRQQILQLFQDWYAYDENPSDHARPTTQSSAMVNSEDEWSSLAT